MTASEKLIAARDLINEALAMLEKSVAAAIDEGVVASLAPVQLNGITESISPFVFDCAAQDFILYGACKLSGLAGEAGILSLENADNTRHLQVGIGYNFDTMLPAAGRVSLRARANADYTHAGVGGVDTTSSGAEFAIHMDSDRGQLNLWMRDGSAWKWSGSCPAPKFQIERIRHYTRSGATAPSGQSVLFSGVVVCRPWAVSIGDSITAGHNLFDPNSTHYAGTDNGLSQWQAHCWPFPSIMNSIIVNKGIGSQTTAMVNARISEVHKHGNPVVLLSVQNNDAGSGVSLAQRTANIQSSINACVAAGCTVVLIGAIYPNNQSTSAYYKQWRDEQLPLLTGHAGYIEIMDAVADSVTGNISSSYATDGVHPNVAGYRLIGEYISTSLSVTLAS